MLGTMQNVGLIGFAFINLHVIKCTIITWCISIDDTQMIAQFPNKSSLFFAEKHTV